MDVNEINQRMRLQKNEFDACADLAEQYRRINATPIVDDDYPAVRHNYEYALQSFLRACRENKRSVYTPSEPILQDWVCELGLRHQGVLVSAIRGCDNVPREDPSKHINRFYRACIMKAHCTDVRKAVSFMKWIDDPEDFQHLCGDFFRSIDHYPNHYILHLAHAAQICGFYMPGEQADWWLSFYKRIVKKFHMRMETKNELDYRLNMDEESFGQAQA